MAGTSSILSCGSLLFLCFFFHSPVLGTFKVTYSECMINLSERSHALLLKVQMFLTDSIGNAYRRGVSKVFVLGEAQKWMVNVSSACPKWLCSDARQNSRSVVWARVNWCILHLPHYHQLLVALWKWAFVVMLRKLSKTYPYQCHPTHGFRRVGTCATRFKACPEKVAVLELNICCGSCKECWTITNRVRHFNMAWKYWTILFSFLTRRFIDFQNIVPSMLTWNVKIKWNITSNNCDFW